MVSDRLALVETWCRGEIRNTCGTIIPVEHEEGTEWHGKPRGRYPCSDIGSLDGWFQTDSSRYRIKLLEEYE